VALPPASALAQVALPEVTLRTPRVVREEGIAPRYYLLSPRLFLPMARIGIGAQFREERATLPDTTAFAADAYLGLIVRAERGARWGAITEAGYGFVGFSQHLASVGLGAVYGLAARADRDGVPRSAGVRVALIPHVLVGTSYDELAVGARTSVLVGYGLYAIEFAHQVLVTGGQGSHEFHLMWTSLGAIGEER
jgi:hypothetical protein